LVGADVPTRSRALKISAPPARISPQKELFGEFWQAGRAWCKESEEINQYDFTSLAHYGAVPYGI
jgi:hypothetical protein